MAHSTSVVVTGRHRSWCFTVNNPVDRDVPALRALCDPGNSKRPKYLIFGYETGSVNGTPHLQGYVSLRSAKTLSGIRQWFPTPAVHFSVARGTLSQNRAYCVKDGHFEEFGQAPAQGKRNDLVATRERLAQGATLLDVVDECTSYASIRFAKEWLLLHAPERTWKTKIIWCHGPTASGKSRWVHEKTQSLLTQGHSLYWKTQGGNQWWDGYYGQDLVVIDDFRADFCKFHDLLNLLDRYPLTLQVKSSHVRFAARTIFITSPKPPQDTYLLREDIQQLLRRIECVLEFPCENPESFIDTDSE